MASGRPPPTIFPNATKSASIRSLSQPPSQGETLSSLHRPIIMHHIVYKVFAGRQDILLWNNTTHITRKASKMIQVRRSEGAAHYSQLLNGAVC